MSWATFQKIAALIGVIAALTTILRNRQEVRDAIAGWIGRIRDIGAAHRARGPWLEHLRGYVLLSETAPVLCAAVLLNALGLVVATRLSSVLYFDMAGTALAAFLLGPGPAACIAVLSSLISWMVFPDHSQANLVILPWTLVNITGGIYWGLAARSAFFNSYVNSSNPTILQHFRFLLHFGLIASIVMSIPGSLIQDALGQNKDLLALDKNVATAIDELLRERRVLLIDSLKDVAPPGAVEHAVHFAMNMVQNTARYIPDKMLGAAFALLVMRYAFPLTERFRFGAKRRAPQSSRRPAIACVLFLALYGLTTVLLLSDGTLIDNGWYVLWLVPVVPTVVCWIVCAHETRDRRAFRQSVRKRARLYHDCYRSGPRNPGEGFSRRLVAPTMFATILVVFGLPFLVGREALVRVAFNFLAVVYGFIASGYVLRVAIMQNMGSARLVVTGASPPGAPARSFRGSVCSGVDAGKQPRPRGAEAPAEIEPKPSTDQRHTGVAAKPGNETTAPPSPWAGYPPMGGAPDAPGTL